MHTSLFLYYGNFLCNHCVISNQCTTILKYINTNTNTIDRFKTSSLSLISNLLHFRRWGFMVPWIVVYAINILGYFAGAIIMFYQLAGPWKALGILPLTIGCFLLVGHFSVLYFCVEQRSDYLSGACNNLVDGSGASSPS